ncbi:MULTISPECIES: hypothetical protein [Butyricicoccaceae]|nr:hypothetical protein [Butyricicoccus sp. AF35-5AC]
MDDEIAEKLSRSNKDIAAGHVLTQQEMDAKVKTLLKYCTTNV